MVQTFAKGVCVKMSENFTSFDFNCHCYRSQCIVTLIHPLLITSLEELWRISGPFKITSGFRCTEHNKDIGGATDSQHPKGTASDCKSLDGKDGSHVAAAAELVPAFKLGGIGRYFGFAHADVRDNGPARWKSGIKSSLIVPC